MSRVFIGGFLGFALLAPNLALAQPLITSELSSVPETTRLINEHLVKITEGSAVASITTYLINLMAFAADKAAYDAAVRLASAGNGETPLVETTPVGDYFINLGKATAGQAIGLLDDQISGPGKLLKNFSLCAPSSSPVLLSIKLGIKNVYEPPKPKCDINNVADKWTEFTASVASNGGNSTANTQEILGGLARLSDPSVSEFSVTTSIQSQVLSKAWQDSTIKTQERLANGDFKAVTNFITKKQETPASVIREDWYVVAADNRGLPSQIGQSLIANKDALLQVGIHAGSLFANTLLSKLTDRIYDGLFQTDTNTTDPFNPADFAQGNEAAARVSYRSFLTATPLQITNFSILADFGSCPQQGRGLYNCVADQSFISAIARASSGAPLTIAEAMEQGLLRPDWPLIPSGDHARDQDPYCYTYGYCHTNLVKLRKARVISVGWEFAADSAANSPNNPVTLREVVEGFDACNAGGQPDENHPWCKLIDPNWVLKYPETQCRAAVNGQLLSSNSSNERQQECVDMPSCIAEDEAGNCTGGYGYCVREENIWRFRGQSCPAQYASCITVKNDSKTVSYLKNTTDSGPCTEDNAGCAWYATEKVQNTTNGAFEFPAIPALLSTAVRSDLNADVYKTRTYFNAAVEDCEAAEGGCHEVIKRDDSLRLNMLVNPSFDQDADRNNIPDGWFFTNQASTVWDVTGALDRSGSAAVKTVSGVVYQTGVEFSQSRFYTLSFYARQEAQGGTERGNMLISFSTDDGTPVDLGGTSTSPNCTFRDGTGDGKLDIVELTGVPAGTTYERFSCTFTSPTQANAATKLFAFVDLMPGKVFIDDVQVEQGQNASSYHDGYSRTNFTTTVVKVAPSYLGCTGSASDPAECAGYAKVCTENDVGCTAYTPVNGDPVVTGVATANDSCPAVCSGYDTFKQEPTRYEPAGIFPLYLIPSTAKKCTEQQVGCDEFTNLTDESKNYFSYIRACVTPAQAEANTTSDNAATFYTWEGSDLSGFQLKTWNLLESNLGSSDFDYAYSTELDTAPDRAPCSAFTATANGISCDDSKDLNGDLIPDWDTPLCDEHADIFANADCREFYDADGNIHYRQWSHTVSVDAACASYRKTDVAGADTLERGVTCASSGGYFDTDAGTCRYNGIKEGSTVCSEQANGCRSYTGGRSRNSRLAFTDLFEDGSLTAWTAGSAASVTLSNESLSSGGHSLSASAPFATYVGDNGFTCLTQGGCPKTGGALGGNCVVANGQQYCGSITPNLVNGKTYTLSFVAKGSGTLTSGFDYQATGSAQLDANFGSVTLTSGWQEYSFGPLDMNAAGFGAGTALAFIPSGSAFVDNIVLREGQDKITLIKNSWVTGAACDQSPNGAASPQYYLGCQEYRDQAGKSSFLKSFSKLCSDDKVGCDSYFMTQESASPHAEIHNATCGTIGGGVAQSATACHYNTKLVGTVREYDTTSPFLCTIGVGFTSCTFNLTWYVAPTVLSSNPATAHVKFAASTLVTPADKDTFLVVTPDVTCASGGAGCTEYGKPTYNQARTATTGATSVYLKNNPAEYADQLCTQDALFCDAWTGTGGTKYYFKDPQSKTCEYRTDVTVGATSYDGWFKTGTSELCYNAPAYVVGGNMSGIWKNGDAQYQGWVGTCALKYDSCSEFQDPLDVSSAELYGAGDGAQYFSLASSIGTGRSATATSDCNGKVSLKEGCGLFNDTSTAAKTFNASATEMASRHADAIFNDAPFSLVDPIDCTSGSSMITLPDGITQVDLCATRCVYDNSRIHDITDQTAGDNFLYGGSCFTSVDCPTVDSESGEKATASACAVVDGTGAAVPRLTNDSNTVIKVNRDRQCSEWLSCADAQTVWDERTNSYKTICGDIGLCTQYSAQGNSSFCSQWNFEDPQVVLDSERYTSRDITWYGDEYSGFAIPNTFPVETLTQANVSRPANTCQYGANVGDPCTQTNFATACAVNNVDVCPATQGQDFRLVLNAGSCRGQDYGSTCTVGSCSETGAACTSTSDCGNSGGQCIVGQCFTISPTDFCTSDAQCGAGRVCNGGACATPGNVVNTEIFDPLFEYCRQTETFVPLATQKRGTCVNDACLLAPNGQAFAFGTTEGKDCRAYPETTSPYSADLVKSWFDSSTQQKASAAQVSVDDVPYETVSGFDRAAFCAPGQDCVCTYKKITYGPGGNSRYYDRSYVTNSQGICTGGSFSGMACDESSQCQTAEDPAGSCLKPSREDVLLGMDGYCLERDSGININGDRNQNACVTWLPVDQLAGSSDLFGKYTSAGYFQDTWACANTDMYAQIAPSQVHATSSSWKGITTIACAQTDNNSATSDITAANSFDLSSGGKMGTCLANAKCPTGYWALIGQADWNDGNNGHIADACEDNPEAVKVNDCPYECIPKGSFVDGKSCDITGEYTTAQLTSLGITFAAQAANKRVVGKDPGEQKSTEGLVNFDDMAKRMSVCRTPAVLWDDTMSAYLFTASHPADSSQFYHLTFTSYNEDVVVDAIRFPACKQVVKVADSNSFSGAAWTDRLLNPNSGFAIGGGAQSSLRYTLDTSKQPYGLILDDAANRKAPLSPYAVAACENTNDVDIYPPGGSAPFNVCTPSSSRKPYVEVPATDPSAPEARSFIDFRINPDGSDYSIQWNPVVSPGPAALINQLFANLNIGVTGALRQWTSWTSGPSAHSASSLKYDAITGTLPGVIDVRATQGKPPTIWAIDPSTCRGTECEEGPANAMTLNDQNTGELSSAHFLRASLKFYAAADKNQLPIRRVIVDWGDDSEDSGSNAPDNFYKNHRGLQPNSTNSICDTAENPEWGMTEESCDPNYFTYTHIYTCPSSFLLSYGTGPNDAHACSFDSAGNLRESPCVNLGSDGTPASCSYQPKTHVRDNWGWCAGVCADTNTDSFSDNSPGCYDGDGSLDLNTTTLDECKYTVYPRTASDYVNPWVYYDGIVTVSP